MYIYVLWLHMITMLSGSFCSFCSYWFSVPEYFAWFCLVQYLLYLQAVGIAAEHSGAPAAGSPGDRVARGSATATVSDPVGPGRTRSDLRRPSPEPRLASMERKLREGQDRPLPTSDRMPQNATECHRRTAWYVSDSDMQWQADVLHVWMNKAETSETF